MLKFCKTQPVKSPTRANATDGGIDFYIPDSFPGARLRHGEAILIASGIKVDVPRGWIMLMENKSGVASKKRLDRLACVIDAGYKGVVHFSMVNNGLQDVILEAGDKIIQGILLPIGSHMPVETAIEEMWLDADEGRGEGGFGSTDYNNATRARAFIPRS